MSNTLNSTASRRLVVLNRYHSAIGDNSLIICVITNFVLGNYVSDRYTCQEGILLVDILVTCQQVYLLVD